jgi:putative aldouronate transport system permease protein
MRQKSFSFANFLIGLILFLFALACFYPFYSIYVYAFNDGLDSMRGPLFLYPRSPTIANFVAAFSIDNIVNAIGVSTLRLVTGTLLSILVTSMLGFAMMMRRIVGYKFFSYYFFITFLFSGGFIPFYLLLKEIQILNTFWALILPGMVSYWYMIIFRSFFDSIPSSIMDSVEVDGASYFTIFFRIYVPLSKPVFAAIGLFVAIFMWNDWFAGEFYVLDANLKPLQTVLRNLMRRASLLDEIMDQGGGSLAASMEAGLTPYAIRVAIVVISVTPIILVYPFLQKHFVKGLMIGSIKG